MTAAMFSICSADVCFNVAIPVSDSSRSKENRAALSTGLLLSSMKAIGFLSMPNSVTFRRRSKRSSRAASQLGAAGCRVAHLQVVQGEDAYRDDQKLVLEPRKGQCSKPAAIGAAGGVRRGHRPNAEEAGGAEVKIPSLEIYHAGLSLLYSFSTPLPGRWTEWRTLSI